VATGDGKDRGTPRCPEVNIVEDKGSGAGCLTRCCVYMHRLITIQLLTITLTPLL
jgi:hypothetical protein